MFGSGGRFSGYAASRGKASRSERAALLPLPERGRGSRQAWVAVLHGDCLPGKPRVTGEPRDGPCPKILGPTLSPAGVLP